MESLNKLETTIEGWLKPIPHLPTTWRKWLAENVWWLTLIGVILSVLGALMLIPTLFFASTLVGVAGVYSGVYAAHTGAYMIAAFVSLALLAVNAVIMGIAIAPLKLQKKKGWDLMFLVLLIGIVSQIASVVLNFGAYSFVSGLLGAAIGAAIGAYFLFEVRMYFVNKKA